MAGERLTLHGCSPTPLASYLKALGVLRLLSSDANNVKGEPADLYARGWWQNESFHLLTSLGTDGVMEFFLRDYAPSPVIAPWNGRAGFLEGDASKTSTREGAVLMREIERSKSARLGRMRAAVHLLRTNADLSKLDQLRAESKSLGQRAKKLTGDRKRESQERKRAVDAQAKALKAVLLPSLRSAVGPIHLDYVDSCFIVATEARPARAAPLLGAGGLDGSRDFGVRFAAELKRAFDLETGEPRRDADQDLRAALLGTTTRLEAVRSMGMFHPGGGGPNATTGYSGENPLNPWDVLLTMEGAIIFAGALTRRWESTGHGGASFPFTFDPVQAGAGGLSAEDPNRPRGEIWAPIWTKPASYVELRAVFSEGRLADGEGTVRNGLDAARAVARLGVARGFTAFERYSLIQPDRQLPFQATPLGRVLTPKAPTPDLVADLLAGSWLDSARRVASNQKKAPASVRTAMRRLEDALFAMTDGREGARGTLRTIIALGDFADWIATNPGARDDLRPPPLLSRRWLSQADDGTPEFRIAVALAGLGIPTSLGAGASGSSEARFDHPLAPPMAAHLAPLTNGPGDGFEEKTFFRGRWLRRHRAWARDNNPSTVVWHHGGLVANMIAVLERRLLESSVRGLRDKPLDSANFARLSDVAAFLSGEFDDVRCSGLLAGMVWVRPVWLPGWKTGRVGDFDVPFAYAALKPIFSSDAALAGAGAIPDQAAIPIPPGLIRRLRAGGGNTDGRATDEAVRTALARARASGLPSPYDAIRSGGGAAGLGRRIGAGIRPDRLAAAMLIPVAERGLTSLLKRAYPNENHHFTNSTEEAPNVS